MSRIVLVFVFRGAELEPWIVKSEVVKKNSCECAKEYRSHNFCSHCGKKVTVTEVTTMMPTRKEFELDENKSLCYMWRVTCGPIIMCRQQNSVLVFIMTEYSENYLFDTHYPKTRCIRNYVRDGTAVQTFLEEKFNIRVSLSQLEQIVY